MSDIMRPMPFAHLMNWILSEYRAQGSVFGVSKLVRHAGGKALPIFEEKIESPYGPAAGPHTQLAQNIIAAYAAGSRFFEVKTVQVMDGEELSKCVSKPCITAADECYNCEWSTELYVPQAFAEYVKAWFACKLLAKELELGDPDGFVFNMSVGYDLKGIQSPKVDAYIEGMKDASGTEVWRECMDWALANLDRFEKVDTEFYTANGLSVDQRGRAVVNPDTLESSVKHVYVVGDGQKGPGTVVEAIAGAARAAQAIHPFDADAWVEQNVNPDYQKPLAKRGDVCTDCASCEDIRCLGCATVCETCTEVCPNRANVAVWVPGMRQRQIIHVDGMCNECGNCATFCPYDSRPYQDKFTLFWRADDFENSRNEGFLRLEDGRTRVRLGGQVADYDVSDAACGLYDPLRRLICAVYENYAYLLG